MMISLSAGAPASIAWISCSDAVASVAFSLGSPCLPASCCAPVETKRGFHVRRRNAFDTTHTLEQLIAAAAIMGLSVKPANENTPAATGMHTAL